VLQGFAQERHLQQVVCVDRHRGESADWPHEPTAFATRCQHDPASMREST
jgi:hypothetical protein